MAALQPIKRLFRYVGSRGIPNLFELARVRFIACSCYRDSTVTSILTSCFPTVIIPSIIIILIIHTIYYVILIIHIYF